MKAARIHSFGGPEVLYVEDVPTPEPKPDEVLVRVHAAGVNPVDWKIREGRLGQIPLPATMGSDFSGEIESLGSEVGDFRVGDTVFGVVSKGSGSYAEYVVAPASQVVQTPAGLTHIQAAALPIASLTAWQALIDTADLKAGQKILIHAAAGGVGSFAVQFGKCKGAYVVGTASAQHIAFVRLLGANEVVDYRAKKFDEVVQDADMVFDTIGGDTQVRSWKALKQGGILVSIVQPPSPQEARAHRVRGQFLVCDHSRSDELAMIADMVVSGEVKVFIATTIPLSEARKAQELSEAGHTQGKIVLRVADN
jgi:NADPH:quinone reductase-like Zn-dependent oxidoreductase